MLLVLCTLFIMTIYKQSLVLLDKGELVSTEKSTDDNDDDTQIRELLKHHFMHRHVKVFLGARNNNEQMLVITGNLVMKRALSFTLLY